MGGHCGVSQPCPNESLRELADVLGEDATREIVRLFLHDFPDSVRRLGTSGHDDQVRIVHGLKSSALHMGARRLSDRLALIEDRLAQGDALLPADTASIVSDFGAALSDLRKYAGA
jgi:hypothetical protein